MLVGQSQHITKSLLKKPNWVELMGTKDQEVLMCLNSDICQETIQVWENGAMVEKLVFLKNLENKYTLYQHLRKHRRVPKCQHAEAILKMKSNNLKKE